MTASHIILYAIAGVILLLAIRRRILRLGMREYAPVEVMKKLNDPSVVLLDVRSHQERNRGRIDGSLHIPLNDLAMEIESLVNEREPNILEIEFHVTKTHAFNEEVRLSKMLNPDVAELFWKYKGLLKERERNTVFWVSTNENLKLAYEKLDKQETELEKAYEIIQKDCAKLQQSNQNLDDFAYAASHDLQEPLRKIHAFSDRLKEKSYTALEDTGRDYIDRIQNAVKRMQRLIDDLLAYSRITTTTTSLASVDLVQIVKDVLSDLEVRIEKSAGSVEVDVLPTLEADPTQMRQLFQNLIGNALKFHKPDKAPFVKVSAGGADPRGVLPSDGRR